MQVMQTRMGQNGRVVIPAEMRAALGLNAGDDVLMELQAGEIRLVALRDSVRQAKALFRQAIPDNRSVVADFIADRKAEAGRE
jgi:AbrB family looped-hinge helix DNA binding protein